MIGQKYSACSRNFSPKWGNLAFRNSAIFVVHLIQPNPEGSMKRLLAILYFSGLLSCYGQQPSPAMHDSMLSSLAGLKSDSTKVMALMRYGWWWENYNMDSAASCYLQMHVLSQQLNYVAGDLKYYANYTFILNQQGKYAKSLALNLDALELAQRKGNREQLAVCLFNTGSSYNNMAKYEEALRYYLEAVRIFEELRLLKNVAVAYDNIGGIFSNIGQLQKGLDYHLKALEKARAIGDSLEMCTAALNAGIQYNKLQRLPEAETYIRQSLAISGKIRNTYLEINAMLTLAEIFLKQNKPDLSIGFAQQCLQRSIGINSAYSEMEALKILTRCYYLKKEYTEAITYGERAVAFSEQNGLQSQLYKVYDVLAFAYHETGNDRAAYTNLALSKNIKDSINEKEITGEIENLEIKYQSAQKEKQILELQQEKKQQQVLIGSMSIGLLVIVVISYLIYKNYRQKRKLLLSETLYQKQRVQELETEKKLITSESIIKGQEDERKRLARDLHDGLGGILSSAKHAFSNAGMTDLNSHRGNSSYENGLAILDHSIRELRRIAHNMMPEALVKFGLNTAIQDLCESTNKTSSINLTYQSFDLQDGDVSKTKVSAIYRIIQELVNNIIRHAEAKNALVQFIKRHDTLSITVEDDGKGFDPNTARQQKGIGFLTMQTRIAYMNGTFDIQTSEGKGTSIHIEIPNISA